MKPGPYFILLLLAAAARQYIALLRLGDQQTTLSAQAQQAEAKLQAMMMDLLELSGTDPDARAIVAKYGIKFNPAQPSALPLEAVLPKPKKGAGTAPHTSVEEPSAAESGAAQ